MWNTCTIQGKDLAHCLWLCVQEGENRFYISARIDGEETILAVGGELSAATELFLRIQRGGVTPCCMADVIEDYWFEKSKISIQ